MALDCRGDTCEPARRCEDDRFLQAVQGLVDALAFSGVLDPVVRDEDCCAPLPLGGRHVIDGREDAQASGGASVEVAVLSLQVVFLDEEGGGWGDSVVGVYCAQKAQEFGDLSIVFALWIGARLRFWKGSPA